MRNLYKRKAFSKKVTIRRMFLLFLSFSLLITIAGCSGTAKKEDKSAAPQANKPVNSADNGKVPATAAPTAKAQEYFIKLTGNRPFAVAFDKKGAMYVVTAPSSGNGTLSRISAKGEVKELATLDGNFMGPGIDVDMDGNAYIAAGNRLLKVSPDGKTTVVSEGFSRCFDVKLDSKGNLFIADDWKDTIYRISPSNEKSVLYKGNMTGSFILTSLAFDQSYKYLYAREGDKILKFDITQDMAEIKPTVVANESDMFYICMDHESHLYASMPGKSTVKKINPAASSTAANTSPIPAPIGLAPGGKGFDENCLYVAAADGIVKISKQ